MIRQPEYNSILVPWKFSENAESALAKALQVGGNSTRVHVVHVAAPLSGPDNGALFITSECSHRGVIRQRFWKDLPETLRGSRIRFDVEFGLVGRELVRFARRQRVDLAIMAKSDKSQLGRMLFGDLEAYLEKHLPCPIDLFTPSAASSEMKSGFSAGARKIASQMG